MPKVAGTKRILRLWDLLVYLDKHPYLPLTKLAADFGETPKQLRKDLALLAGIETPDNVGFYLIDLDFDALDEEGLVKLTLTAPTRIPLQLNDEEVAPIIAGLKAIAETAYVQTDTSRKEVVQSAITKLAAKSGTGSDAVEVKIPTSANSQVANIIAAAIANQQQLNIEYVNHDDVVTTRIVDPAVIVTQNRHAYLRAWCHNRDKPRAFRIDRILSATPQANQAHPDHLTAISRDADIGKETATHGAFDVVITLAPAARWLAEELPGQVKELGDGRFSLALHVTSEAWIIRLLLGVAPLVLDVQPPELAAAVAQQAQAALANYR